MHVHLYRSRARAGLLAPDLNAIIAVAQAKNAAAGITGLLLYGNLPAVPTAPGEFVQWLEGPEDAVEGIVAQIEEDDRHFGVETLANGPSATVAQGSGLVGPDDRVFADWAMGLVRLSRLPATLPGFLTFARGWDRQPLAAAA